MSLSWVFHAELPRVPPAHKLHATFFLWTSLYIAELILSCYRNVSVSFPIRALFSRLTCGWLVLPFVPVVPPEYQICVASFLEVREGLWLWGDTSHPDWFNLWCCPQKEVWGRLCFSLSPRRKFPPCHCFAGIIERSLECWPGIALGRRGQAKQQLN